MNNSKEIKCVVWDLDNTLWQGTLSEGDTIILQEGIREIIVELDRRGILNSIASKNNHDDAWAKIEELQLAEFFLYPEIHWNAKSYSIENIRKNLNIGIDTFLFIDDQAFERDEVKSQHPEVETVDASKYAELLGYDRLNPKFITTDSKRRRLMYQEDIKRNVEEEDYQGPQDEFLASLNMEFVISEAVEEDLKRAEELTERTNQLNATGKTYNYDELLRLSQSDKHKLYVCELKDNYGSYGKIGLALVEIHSDYWHLKMMLMSCRVLSKSVGSVLMTYLMKQAERHGDKLLADFKHTDRNRMMFLTFKFSGFTEKYNEEGLVVFENNLSGIQPYPTYINVLEPDVKAFT
ncbi:MAG: HAD-IIIC family phosphatase [Cyclobacteriaceae bacterium]